MKKPCYKCEKRHPGCHSSCKDYLEEVEEREAKKEAQRKARDLDNAINCIHYANSKQKSKNYKTRRNRR